MPWNSQKVKTVNQGRLCAGDGKAAALLTAVIPYAALRSSDRHRCRIFLPYGQALHLNVSRWSSSLAGESKFLYTSSNLALTLSDQDFWASLHLLVMIA